MKRRIFLTLIPALAACFALAGAERTAQRPTEPQPAELRGRVTADGRGVEGVAVTDGRTIVRTDAKGRYRLASASDAEFVYLTLPDGYEIPAEAGAAAFYRRITGQERRYDFALRRAGRDMTRHRLVLVADPQVYFEEELDSVRRASADIRRTASDGVETFGVACGDIIGDITRRPTLFGPVRDALVLQPIRQ